MCQNPGFNESASIVYVPEVVQNIVDGCGHVGEVGGGGCQEGGHRARGYRHLQLYSLVLGQTCSNMNQDDGEVTNTLASEEMRSDKSSSTSTDSNLTGLGMATLFKGDRCSGRRKLDKYYL